MQGWATSLATLVVQMYEARTFGHGIRTDDTLNGRSHTSVPSFEILHTNLQRRKGTTLRALGPERRTAGTHPNNLPMR